MLTAVSAMLVFCGCERPAQTPARPSFDGAKAMEYARQQLDFGPRVPGTEAHQKAGDWIAGMMRARADSVIEQRWMHVTAKGDTLPLRNVFARFRPEVAERVLYVAHWDSRPTSDQATDSAKRKLPVPGANDGASGVALLVALGDLLKAAPPSVGVDLLFVDGEDYGQFGPPEVDVLLGSKHFAANLPFPDYRPLFGVLWDMVGDRELRIEKEEHSQRQAPEVVARVWEAAASLGYANVFVPTEGVPVTDDHIPLLNVGIRIIDVIDLDYPWHHTPEDTIDKISVKSLKTVGDVAWELLK